MNPVKKHRQKAPWKRNESSSREQKRDLPTDISGNNAHPKSSLEILLESQAALLENSLNFCRKLIQTADVQIEEIANHLYENRENELGI